ncbi:TMEM165/GDT1 family protein [Halomonas shantousis]
MDALLTSALAVGLAEIGDKTQLLVLLLAARFMRPWPIFWGMLSATLINHGVSAWLGASLANVIDESTLTLVVGFAFVAIGLWLLRPDDEDDLDAGSALHGVFLTSFVLFSLAEIGDKTQLATVLLGARFHDMLAVTVGTTLAMMMVNAPVLWAGNRFCKKLPLKSIHFGASMMFIAIGLWTLVVQSGWLVS